MRVLQLCCFTNFWDSKFKVESWDIRNGKNVLDMPYDYGKSFDIIVSAPPCNQFTKANAHHWEVRPELYIDIAQKCFDVSVMSGRAWYLENPPGRIEKFLPGLKQYRLINFRFPDSNKEYIIYGNTMLLNIVTTRYGNSSRRFNNMSVKQREAWHPDLIKTIQKTWV